MYLGLFEKYFSGTDTEPIPNSHILFSPSILSPPEKNRNPLSWSETQFSVIRANVADKRCIPLRQSPPKSLNVYCLEMRQPLPSTDPYNPATLICVLLVPKVQ